MKNFQLLFTAALVMNAAIAGAQSVSYKVYTDDPNAYKRTMAYIDVFDADTYLGASIGSAVKLESSVGERIMPWVQVKYSFLDMNTHHVVSGYPTNAGGQKKQMIIDIGSALYLTNHNKKRSVKVVLSSHSSGRYTYTKYIMVPATIKKMFGFEGGLYYNRRALAFDEKSHQYFHYKSTDGQYEVPIAEVGSSPAIQPSGEYYKPLSMTHVFSLYGGIHFRKIVNVTILSESYGECSHRSASDLYLDVMLAGPVPIANVIDNSGKEWVLSPQAGAIRHIGWRAGYTFHNSRRTSLEYNFEFGQKPGPVMGKDMLNNGTYISLGMGFTIGFNKYFNLGGAGSKKASDESGS